MACKGCSGNRCTACVNPKKYPWWVMVLVCVVLTIAAYWPIGLAYLHMR